MNLGWVAWMILGIAGVFALVVSYLFTSFFCDMRTTTRGYMMLTVISLSVSLLGLLIIPVDIYNIDKSTGSEYRDYAEAVHIGYCVCHSLMVLWNFAIVPAAFFYDGTPHVLSNSARLVTSLKYIIPCLVGTLMVFGGACVMASVVDVPHHPSSGWASQALDGQNEWYRVSAFLVALMATLGLPLFCIYTAFGLALLPMVLIRRRSHRGDEAKSEIALEKQQIEGEIRDLRGKNDAAGREMSKKDRKRVEELEQQLRLLGNRSSLIELDDGNTLAKCCGALKPFGQALGVILLIAAAGVVASAVTSILDCIFHSHRCIRTEGYVHTGLPAFNVLDWLLRQSSEVFPVDYVVFSLVLVLVFCGTLAGVTFLGLAGRFSRYQLVRGGSDPQGLLLACLVVAFTMNVLFIAIVFFAPTYVTFGSQTQVGSDEHCQLSAIPQPEPFHITTPHTEADEACRSSEISRIVNMVRYLFPWFGVIWYWSIWVFSGMSVFGLIYSIFRRHTNMFGWFSEFEEEENAKLIVQTDNNI